MIGIGTESDGEELPVPASMAEGSCLMRTMKGVRVTCSSLTAMYGFQPLRNLEMQKGLSAVLDSLECSTLQQAQENLATTEIQCLAT